MPLPVPNLDDRTFADLVAEGRAMIPRLAPEWTNHNPADPGITLLELLAFLTESVLYDINQVREDSYRSFLALVDSAVGPGESLEAAIARTVASLGAQSRAVGTDDFEALAGEVGGVARARAIPDLNLEGNTASGEAHLSLVILPSLASIGLPADPGARSCGALQAAMASPAMGSLRSSVAAALEDRLLVTSVLHVVAPRFVSVSAAVQLQGNSDADAKQLGQDAEGALRRFLDPYVGGEEGRGWPFGRAVYKSELLLQLEALPGVDHVDLLTVNDDATDNPVTLLAHELVCVGAVSVSVDLEGA
jgi:hypothetical protein